jgi:hypothetical protein
MVTGAITGATGLRVSGAVTGGDIWSNGVLISNVGTLPANAVITSSLVVSGPISSGVNSAIAISSSIITAGNIRAIAISSSYITANTITAGAITVGTLFYTNLASAIAVGTAINQTSLGISAGFPVTGQFNVNIGYQAGQRILGSSNANIGKECGWDVTGDGNAALGYEALTVVHGGYNVFGGYRAGQRVSGNYNIGFGNNAVQFVTGNNNIGLGNGALNNWVGNEGLHIVCSKLRIGPNSSISPVEITSAGSITTLTALVNALRAYGLFT